MDKLLAFKNVDTFRAIQALGEDATNAALAKMLERDPSNMIKTLGLLAADGLISRDPIALTDQAEAILKADDVAEGRAGLSRDEDPANLSLRHADILPDPDNARRDWTSDDAVADLAALANDIRDNGLLQNLIVRPHPDPLNEHWILVGGERRWRALGLLIDRGEWLAEQTVPARRLNTTEIGTRLAALAENLQRRNLNPIEEAAAYRGLREVGLTTEQIADKVTMTQRHVQGRLQLLDLLTEDQQRRMTLPADDKDRLSVSDARKLVQNAEAKQKARDKAEAELSPRARLIFAEMRLATGEGYIFARLQVDGLAMNADEDAVALEKEGLIKAPTTWTHDGKTEARCDDKAWDLTQALFPGGAAPYAAAMRAELGLPEPAEGQWSTPWMNGPFEVPEPVAADLAAKAKARDEENARAVAENEERKAILNARAARWSEALARQRAVLVEAHERPDAVEAEAARDIAQAADHPLPWRLSADGATILNAEGGTIIRITENYWAASDDQDRVAAGLIVVAVNGAAHLQTPAPEPEPSPEAAQDAETEEGEDEAEEDEDGEDD